MSGPFIAERVAQPLDLMLQAAGGSGWEGIEQILKPVIGPPSELMPDEATAKFLYGLYCTVEGRRMFEWFMDLTVRRPLSLTAPTIEQTALLAAGRQAVNSIAEVLLKAVAHGEELVRNSKSPNGADR